MVGQLPRRTIAGYCPRCGQPLPAQAAFCGACGTPTPGPPLLPAGPPQPAPGFTGPPATTGPPPAARGNRALWVIVIAVGVVVAAILILAVVPVAQSASFKIYSTQVQPGDYSKSFPDGVSVSGHWSATGAKPVSFTVVGFLLSQVVSENGTAGSFVFTAELGPYLFSVDSANTTSPVTTSVTVTYNAPLL